MFDTLRIKMNNEWNIYHCLACKTTQIIMLTLQGPFIVTISSQHMWTECYDMHICIIMLLVSRINVYNWYNCKNVNHPNISSLTIELLSTPKLILPILRAPNFNSDMNDCPHHPLSLYTLMGHSSFNTQYFQGYLLLIALNMKDRMTL